MKNILLIPLFLIGIIACKQRGNDVGEVNPQSTFYDSGTVPIEKKDSFGKTVNKEGAVPANTLPALMRKQDSLNINLIGKVVGVCRKKGCWMTIDLENGDTMRVTFRDYGFFVPQEAFGKQAIIKGTAKRETTTVDKLRHYAQDAGKSAKEIAAINNAEEELVFVADEVVLEWE